MEVLFTLDPFLTSVLKKKQNRTRICSGRKEPVVFLKEKDFGKMEINSYFLFSNFFFFFLYFLLNMPRIYFTNFLLYLDTGVLTVSYKDLIFH